MWRSFLVEIKTRRVLESAGSGRITSMFAGAILEPR